MQTIREVIYILIPQGEEEFKGYAESLIKLLKISGIKQTFELIEYQCNKSNKENRDFVLRPKIKINQKIPQLRHTFYIFGHGFQNADIGAERPDSRIRCCNLLKYINDLFTQTKLRFRSEVILTQCYGYEIKGIFPNISVDTVSSVDIPLTLVSTRDHTSRNLSLMLYVVKSWFWKYYQLLVTSETC
jgi:hypothetical protein